MRNLTAAQQLPQFKPLVLTIKGTVHISTDGFRCGRTRILDTLSSDEDVVIDSG